MTGSWLRLVLQAPLLGQRRVWVRIDDVPVPTQPGENLLPVAPGRHTIAITDALHQPLVSEFDVGEGETASLHFAPPFQRFDRGSLGPGPQRVRGPGFLAVVGVLIVLGLLVQTFLR